MDTAISAANANRSFSHQLRPVRGGASCIVTTHGKPEAHIVPFGAAHASRITARSALLRRLRAQPVNHIGRWNRDER